MSFSPLFFVIACGLVSVIYAIWATRSVLAADQGSARMQEIAGAIREGAKAYLARQYTAIAIVGVGFIVNSQVSRYTPPGSAPPSAGMPPLPPSDRLPE